MFKRHIVRKIVIKENSRNDCGLGIIEQKCRRAERRLKNELSSGDAVTHLPSPLWEMKQQVAVFYPIRIIQRVQQASTWITLSHKLPICFFNDVDWSLMNVANATLQDAPANHVSYLFIY